MTIMEAITRVDSIKPNSYEMSEKIKWLSELDGVIKREIIDTHEGGDSSPFAGYGEDTDESTVLLVPFPYDEVYVRYLEMQIDYANGEYGKYNNSRAMYQAAFGAFCAWYNREHMPRSRGKRFLF